MKLGKDFIICLVFTTWRNTSSIYKKRKDFIKIEFETSSKFIEINKLLDIKVFKNGLQREIAKISSWRNGSNLLGPILLVILIHYIMHHYTINGRDKNKFVKFLNNKKSPSILDLNYFIKNVLLKINGANF